MGRVSSGRARRRRCRQWPRAAAAGGWREGGSVWEGGPQEQGRAVGSEALLLLVLLVSPPVLRTGATADLRATDRALAVVRRRGPTPSARPVPVGSAVVGRPARSAAAWSARGMTTLLPRFRLASRHGALLRPCCTSTCPPHPLPAASTPPRASRATPTTSRSSAHSGGSRVFGCRRWLF